MIHCWSSVTPAESTMFDASGGIPLASRRFARATSTEFDGLPGAMMRAPAPMPRSPDCGGASQAAVLESSVE